MTPIFYHTSTCPQCKMVEMLLKKNNIVYESIEDVDAILEKGITHTPALEIDGQIKFGKDIISWINNKR